jgi:hypothetical protein
MDRAAAGGEAMTADVREDRSVAVESNGTAPAPNVIQALAAVRRELKGIAKDHEADPRQGGYAYRSIEDITAAVGPLLGTHCVLFAPRVTKQTTKEIEVNNKPWTDTFLSVEYDVYGPGGIADHIVVGPVEAIGRDNTDKGANKALSQAYKQVLGQVFCIGNSKDDTDGQTAERDARRQSVETYAGADEAKAKELGWNNLDELVKEHDDYKVWAKEASEDERARARAYKATQGIGWPMTPEQMRSVIEAASTLTAPRQVIAPETGEKVDVERPPDGPPLRREDLTPVPVPEHDEPF